MFVFVFAEVTGPSRPSRPTQENDYASLAPPGATVTAPDDDDDVTTFEDNDTYMNDEELKALGGESATDGDVSCSKLPVGCDVIETELNGGKDDDGGQQKVVQPSEACDVIASELNDKDSFYNTNKQVKKRRKRGKARKSHIYENVHIAGVTSDISQDNDVITSCISHGIDVTTPETSHGNDVTTPEMSHGNDVTTPETSHDNHFTRSEISKDNDVTTSGIGHDNDVTIPDQSHADAVDVVDNTMSPDPTALYVNLATLNQMKPENKSTRRHQSSRDDDVTTETSRQDVTSHDDEGTSRSVSSRRSDINHQVRQSVTSLGESVYSNEVFVFDDDDDAAAIYQNVDIIRNK